MNMRQIDRKQQAERCRRRLRNIADNQTMTLRQKQNSMESLLFRVCDKIGRDSLEFTELRAYATRLMQACAIAC